jgi:hypothetical protein
LVEWRMGNVDEEGWMCPPKMGGNGRKDSCEI